MTLQEIAKKYVSLCKEHRNGEAVETLFADDVVSVEAAQPPNGNARETKGKAAVAAKGKWWAENHIVHASEAFGPYPHGDDQFAVRFVFDVTFKPTNTRRSADEVAVFHVRDGKIVREAFFYPTP